MFWTELVRNIEDLRNLLANNEIDMYF